MDDEGFGYKDNGADIWDDQDGDQEPGNKKRKKLAKDEQTMNQFLYSAGQKPKKGMPVVKKQAVKVNEQESKDILN